jgi:hypothetical protein
MMQIKTMKENDRNTIYVDYQDILRFHHTMAEAIQEVAPFVRETSCVEEGKGEWERVEREREPVSERERVRVKEEEREGEEVCVVVWLCIEQDMTGVLPLWSISSKSAPKCCA